VPVPPADSLRAALDSVFAQPAYRWIERPAPLRWLALWWHRLGDWLAALQAGDPFLFRVLAIGLVVVLVLVFLHALWVVLRTVRAASAAEARGAPGAIVVRRDAAWHLAEGDRLAVAGRYVDALQHAFLALALVLDGRGVVRFHPSKTPGEYAREARLPADERTRLRTLVGQLYAGAFGGAPVGAEDYRRWRDALTEWHAPAR
jgi:Domain of unknown function (DUF4129)